MNQTSVQTRKQPKPQPVERTGAAANRAMMALIARIQSGEQSLTPDQERAGSK